MDKKIPDLVIYHGGCPDGTVGAWCFWREYQDRCTYHAGRIGDEPPAVDNLHVYLIDFAYDVPTMQNMCKRAASVTVLDHHRTTTNLYKLIEQFGTLNKFSMILDQTKCGAQIAWDYLNTTPRPWFVDDVGDRDRWVWTHPGSMQTTTCMYHDGLYENFKTINTIEDRPRDYYVQRGTVIKEILDTQYAAAAKTAVWRELYDANARRTYSCRVVQCPAFMRSDVCNILLDDPGCDIAVALRYNIPTDEWWGSFRSNTIDLSQVLPAVFGNGGGHRQASGCTVLSATDAKKLSECFSEPLARYAQPNSSACEPSQ